MIKSTVESWGKKQEIKFPILMGDDNGLVILFWNKYNGIALNGIRHFDPSGMWDICDSRLTPFTGAITLRNED